MKNKGCKECPWIVDNKNNNIIRDHSIRYKKKHNCHLLKSDIWDIEDNKVCKGIKHQ
jgi:hypothetical protein